MKKESSQQSLRARRQLSPFKTPKRRRCATSMAIVPPPAPRKRGQSHQFCEPRYTDDCGGGRSLFLPTCRLDTDVKASGINLITVHLKPRLASCISPQPESRDGYPLFPSLDDDCSDDDSEASDFSPLPQTVSDLPDF